MKRVRNGTATATMRRRFRGERRFRVGKNVWYLVRGKRSRVLFKTRAGKVREIGIADLRLTRSRKVGAPLPAGRSRSSSEPARAAPGRARR